MKTHLDAARVLTLFLFLDCVAQSIVTPLLPRLAADVQAGDLAAAAWLSGFLELCWALPQVFAAPWLGAMSDRFGRKPLLLLSGAGVAAELLLDTLASGPGWLVLGRVICGLCNAGQALAFAALGDLHTPEQRPAAFARGAAAMWAGIIVGPGLGGLLADIGLRVPFVVALGVGILAWLLLLGLPETHLDRPAALESPGLGLKSLKFAPRLALAFGLTAIAVQGVDNLIVLYTERRYGWGAAQFGLVITLVAGIGWWGQAWLAPRAFGRLGTLGTARLGLAFQGAGALGMGLASAGGPFLGAYAASMVGSLAKPALQAAIAERVPEERQGELHGALSALGAGASVVAPPVFAGLFVKALSLQDAWLGLPVLVSAGVIGLAIGVSMFKER